jgi:cytochrome c oxidase subunit 2
MMFGEVAFYPTQASTTAHSVDMLVWFLFGVCGAVGLLVATLLIGFAIRYRRRPGGGPPGPMPGNTPLEVFWTVTPMLIFVVFFIWGATVYFNAYRAPDDSQVVYVVAKQWMWKFQHPEGQREIDELHVPAGRPVKLLLTSEDVIHSFFVPAFRVHMDVLPGRYTTVWFTATEPGEYHLFCSQYCGTGHAGMIGKVVVQPPEEYQQWLQYHAEGSLALQGRKIFLKYRCISCHSANENARAPVLEALFGKTVRLRDGRTVRADEAYIRQSVLDPGAKIVAGYENIMPTFEGQLDEEEIIKLIAFLEALGPGETPDRVEQYPPPGGTPPIETPEKKP